MRKLLIAFVAAIVLLAGVAPVAVAGSGGAAATDAQTQAQAQAQAQMQGQEDSLTCEYPLELDDATGETVTIDEEPDSVVALQPSDAQVLFEIGAEDTVDGMPVGAYTDYLDADEDLDISEDDGLTPVTEEVIDRDPDVVLAANTLAGDDVIERLRSAGLTVYVFPTEESLDGVVETVRLTGEIVGECDGAAETLDWMDEQLEIIDEAIGNEDRPLAYYAMGDGFTAGEGTFQHEILTTAGVDNLGTEVGLEGWDTVSEEDVLAEDPEWIVYGDSWDEPPVSDAVMATTASENEQFVTVNNHFMSQPGPLVVAAISELAETVHPDAYEAAEMELETDVTTASDDGDADQDADASDGTDEDGATDDSIPGFGVSAAVAVLLAVAVGLIRRR